MNARLGADNKSHIWLHACVYLHGPGSAVGDRVERLGQLEPVNLKTCGTWGEHCHESNTAVLIAGFLSSESC